MLQRFREFRFQHPVTLFEFGKMRQYSHSLVSLGPEQISDDSFVTRPRDQVDVTKPILHCNDGNKIPTSAGILHLKICLCSKYHMEFAIVPPTNRRL
jgi:hypothetical protein